MRRDIEWSDEFLSDVIPEPMSGCWIWVGRMRDSSGYGRLSKQYAHRASFERYIRALLPGEFVLHHCDNKACVNPLHLFAGSAVDNVRDMIQKGRDRTPAAANRKKTHCIKGHAFTPENTQIRPSGARACRTCKRLDGRVWDAAHREAARLRNRAWKATNRALINERQHARRAAHAA